MATWYTVEQAQEDWIDAPMNEERLAQILDAARDAVLAYAPALPPQEPVVEDGYITPASDAIPASYREAQLLQARNIWNSSKASPTGDFDGGSFGLTTYPLDWQVKQLLRPRTIFGGPAR